MNHEKVTPPTHTVETILWAAGSAAFLYCVSFWGFKQWVKDLVYERQGGKSPTGGPIEEYHHIVPERMLRRDGIQGKNTPENCVGLGFDEHKHVWDKLCEDGIFYPGVTLDQLDPDTYNYHPRKHNNHRRRRR